MAIIVKSMDLDQVRDTRYDELVELSKARKSLKNSHGDKSKQIQANITRLETSLGEVFTKELIKKYIFYINNNEGGNVLRDNNSEFLKADYFYCGSNQLDNSKHPYSHYLQVAKDANFQPLSVVDIIQKKQKKEPGTFLGSAGVRLEKNPPLDNSKFLLLYSQMHDVALQKPSEEIEFYFYENDPKKLEKLSKMFRSNTQLFPKYITLILDSIPSRKEVKLQGSGDVNPNYKEIIKEAYIECMPRNGNFNAIDKLGTLATHMTDVNAFKQAVESRNEVKAYKADMEKLINDLKDKHTSVFTSFINLFIPLHRYTMIQSLKNIQAGTYNNASEIKNKLETFSTKTKTVAELDKKLGEMFKTMKDRLNLEVKSSEETVDPTKPRI